MMKRVAFNTGIVIGWRLGGCPIGLSLSIISLQFSGIATAWEAWALTGGWATEMTVALWMAKEHTFISCGLWHLDL